METKKHSDLTGMTRTLFQRRILHRERIGACCFIRV
jgi:hypothetical protein